APRPDEHAGESRMPGEAAETGEAPAPQQAPQPAVIVYAPETTPAPVAPEVQAEPEAAPEAPAAEPAATEAAAPAQETLASGDAGNGNGGEAYEDMPGDEGDEAGEDMPDPEAAGEDLAPAAPYPNEDVPADPAVAAEDHGVTAEAVGALEQVHEEAAEGEAAKPAAPNGAPAQQRREEHRGRDRGGRGNGYERRHTVQEMLRRGHEVLVQVAKEGMGQKGPALTTYLSLPGRYLVLMPAVQRLGVSKRIDSEEQRRALKDILAHLKTPEGMGVIVRTAGMGRSQEELQRDLDFLMQKWEALKKKAQIARAPALLFQEGDVITRVFRDILADDVTEIIVDDPVVMERAKEFLREMAPGSESKIKLYSGHDPIFHKYGVERQLSLLFNRKVALKGGGSIVIEQTEAMVAIDVNTGRYREKHTQDETILATNLEAAREVARQLRLRDIGGLVMIDFIDMDHMEHRRRVEREFKAHLARDKARINVMPISPLGIVEMTRQRVRHGIRRALFERCPHCHGAGQVKSPETIGLEVLRELRAQLSDHQVARVRVTLHSASACAILNRFRRDFIKLEDARGMSIEVASDDRIQPGQFQIATAKAGGDFVVKKVSEVDDYVRNS
ncbi:MAG: Rne/Rng family ribonuclease, partial [Planctomycetota bacterium]|nr:Rne/Rng family ribonuclease [Planctomycetota bacterium]